MSASDQLAEAQRRIDSLITKTIEMGKDYESEVEKIKNLLDQVSCSALFHFDLLFLPYTLRHKRIEMNS